MRRQDLHHFRADLEPAREIGIDAGGGLIITEVDRKPVANMRDFNRVYRGIKSGASFLIRARPANADGTLITALADGRKVRVDVVDTDY